MSDIVHNAKVKNLARLTIYVASVLTISFICVYVIPRRGLDFTDHGYYLYNGFLASEGVIPGPGFAGFFNAIFMKIGLGGYYFLEVAYFIFACLSLTLIWKGLQRSFYSLLYPITVLTALMSQNITSIGSYQNLPVYFLLIGMFFLFRYLDSTEKIKNKVYLILSAFTLSLTCFINISLLPLAILILLAVPVLMNFKSDKRPYEFLALFVFFYIVFYCLYKYSPLDIFNIVGVGNGVSLLGYLNKLSAFLGQYFITSKYFKIWAASAFLNRCFLYRYKKLSISVLIYIITAVFFFLIMHNIVLYFLYLPMITLLSFFRFETFYYRVFVLFLLLFAANVCLVLTTLSAPLTHTVFFVPGYVLVVGSIIDDIVLSCKDNALVTFTVTPLFYIVGCCIIYDYIMIQPYRAYPITARKYPVNSPFLNVIKANKDKVLAVNHVIDTYNAYGCDKKPVVFFPAMPLFYYLVHRHAYKDLPWISPTVTPWIKEGGIISYLDSPKGYCVFYAPGFDLVNFTYPMVIAYLNKNHKISKFQQISNLSGASYFPSKILFFEN